MRHDGVENATRTGADDQRNHLPRYRRVYRQDIQDLGDDGGPHCRLQEREALVRDEVQRTALLQQATGKQARYRPSLGVIGCVAEGVDPERDPSLHWKFAYSRKYDVAPVLTRIWPR